MSFFPLQITQRLCIHTFNKSNHKLPIFIKERHREQPFNCLYCAGQMSSADIQFVKTNRSLTLIVGDMEVWVSEGREMPEIDGYFFVDIANLTPAFLREVAPEVVLSALVGRKFDAVEVARKLGHMDFPGAYRILTQNLPDPALILSEIGSVAPELDVDVIDLANIFPNL